MDYRSFIFCLTRYDILETTNEFKDYTRRYRQFLLQVFSRDSVLQLVPHSAIQLLREYSTGSPHDHRLRSLIPALGMIFINMPTLRNEIEESELRGLSATLADRATVTYDDLVNNRHHVRTPLQPPPSLPQDWEDTGSFYGKPHLHYRPFYEG